MKKAMKIAIWGIAIAAALGGGGYYWWSANKPAPLEATYQLHTVARDEVSEKVTASGTVEPLRTVTLYLDAAQTVRTVHIKPGDAVAEHDVLVDYDIEGAVREWDRRREEAVLNHQNAELILQGIASPAEGNELLQYQSEVTAAQKNIFDAETDLQSLAVRLEQQRIRVGEALRVHEENGQLLANGLLTQSAFDSAEAAYKSAEQTYSELLIQQTAREKALESRGTQLADAQARLANAQNKMKDTATALRYAQQQNAVRLAALAIEEIDDALAKFTEQTRCPVAGGVLSVNAVEGAVLPKGALVVKIADLSDIVVRAEVSEYDAPLLVVGQSVEIFMGGLPDAVYTGYVSKIAANAVDKEKSSGNEVVVPIEIAVANADGQLKTGYSVDVDVFLSWHEDVICVPAQALRYNGAEAFVYVLQDGKAVQTAVALGLRGDRMVEVSDGLRAGDVLLLDY